MVKKWWMGFGVAVLAAAVQAQTVKINEIRIDQPSTDNDEYFELAGTMGDSLDGYFYVVIGDGVVTLGSGVVEAVVDLTGKTITKANGTFLVAEGTFTLRPIGEVDFVANINFENSDNVTHMLVKDFTGAAGDDLDTDDDCVLDVTPWSEIVDVVGMIKEPNPPTTTECHYAGSTTVGPEDCTLVPGHIWRNANGEWQLGPFFTASGADTPGLTNAGPTTFAIELDGNQEVPPVPTSATGRGYLRLNALETSCFVFVEHDVVSPSVAHIHKAPRGTAGGVVLPFTSPVSPIQEEFLGLAAGVVADLKAGLLYVNVHSPTWSAGEIRGQIELPTPCTGTEELSKVKCKSDGVAVTKLTAKGKGAAGGETLLAAVEENCTELVTKEITSKGSGKFVAKFKKDELTGLLLGVEYQMVIHLQCFKDVNKTFSCN